MALSKEEINRKLLHILSGSLIPLGIFYIPELFKVPNWIPMLIIGVLLFISLVTELIRFKFPAIQKLFLSFAGSMLRPEENKKMTGATYIFGSAFLCTIFFYNQPHISFMVISLFIFGDAAAAIVGLSIGKIKIGKKSLEGSLACFCLCLLMCFFVFPYIPELLNKWNGTLPLSLVVLTSLSITVFELFPLRISKNIVINDNLVVPIVTGFIMLKVYPFL